MTRPLDDNTNRRLSEPPQRTRKSPFSNGVSAASTRRRRALDSAAACPSSIRSPVTSLFLLCSVLLLSDCFKMVDGQEMTSFQCLQARPAETGCPQYQACQVSVCSIQHTCCTLSWDDACVELASTECYQDTFRMGDGDGTLSDCVASNCNSNPGCCSNQDCLDVVQGWCDQRVGLSAGIPGINTTMNETEALAPSNTTQDPKSPPTSPPNNGPTNSCFEVSKKPGCSDPACEARLCDVDDYCCERTWDLACTGQAMDHLDICTEGWPEPDNDCFEIEPFGRPNCNDLRCLDRVCVDRPSCCSDNYDLECVNTAKEVCVLPEPQNHCFKTSRLPGCTDTNCMEKVICNERPECCTFEYSQECVELAKNHHADHCPAPTATNDCLEPSAIGGCIDVRCARAVCDIQSDCCNTDTEVGLWDNPCVRIAEELCQPDVFDRPPGRCPVGFTCSENEMANCTEIRTTARDVFEIGDIYAGIYCGDVADDGYNLKNCDIGYYCPTPEERYPCPEGFFCPHKTQTPDIKCNRCKEGAVKLERDLFGYAGLVAAAILTAIGLAYKLISRYNRDFVQRLHAFERNVFLNRLQEFEHRILEFRSSNKRFNSILSLGKNKSTQQEMKKIRHKIELINRRLASLEESRSTTSRGSANTDSTSTNNNNNDSSNRLFQGSHRLFRSMERLSYQAEQQQEGPTNSGSKKDSNNFRFDARRVFDALDLSSTGELSFQELNAILGLNDLELHEFVRRMNELAGYKRDRQSVTRPVFAKYFLQVLKETSNLTVSFEEAEVLFDEMADMGEGGKLNEVHMSAFYNSSMSGFLSDLQICDLIRRFKKLSAELGNNSRRPSIFFSATGSNNGIIRLPTGFGGGGSTRRMSVARRRSSFRSQGSAGQVKDTRMVISREDFVENYPQLLLEVTMDNDTVMGELEADGDDFDWQFPGVDICFQDLSLSIQIGEKTIRVVDEVTGRIRAKTMTALMGGSGAGKTSLLNALCGRAFYGDVTGSIHLNGHETSSIEHYKDSVGFVPQDDIVYPELTVRENLMYAGRFRLPRGTLDEEIEDLADTTMANLGLSRVAESLVGDVRRRGVSGGERKRVNIGIELMANPSILFLDEPTSGLDASSALLVMKALKHLVEKDGVTVVSVIHQPRKFIYDLFDSLILLGVGGNMVYHGPRDSAVPYFNRLHYCLPEGESVADWLIDISSGRLEPDCQIARCRKSEYMSKQKNRTKPTMDDHQDMATGRNNQSTESVSTEPEHQAEESHFAGNDGTSSGTDRPNGKDGGSRHSHVSEKDLVQAPVESPNRPGHADATSRPTKDIQESEMGMDDDAPKCVDDCGENDKENNGVRTQAVDLVNKVNPPTEQVEETTNDDDINKVLSMYNVQPPLLEDSDNESGSGDWKITSLARGNMGEDILNAAATNVSKDAPAKPDDELELCETGNSFPTSEGTESASLKHVSSVGSFDLDTIYAEPPPLERTITNQTSGMSLGAAGRCVTDKDCVGARGVTTGKIVQAAEEAKHRRKWLYKEWTKYFDNLDVERKKNYEVPNPYPLPVGVKKPSFFYQLTYQTQRIFTVAWRNRFSKFIDSVIIIGSLIVITALDGVAVVTEDVNPDVPFEVMVRPNLDDSQELFTGLFKFALTRQIQYALKAGIVICALVGLTATKVLTEKRLMFFREAASGYNLNAYYIAVNIMATTEHTIQVLVAAYFAIWIRNPVASGGSFVIHFLLLGWVVVSWSLLIPMVTPPETVMIVGAFFFVFCALMFSGAFPPILYHQIYEEGGMFQEVFAGWVAATRFFFEAITVGEYRCLPEQTGYTISEAAINRASNSSVIVALGYAGRDRTATRRSCTGWYWSVIPSLLVGLTVRYLAWLCMHGFQRGEQTKKPLLCVMRSDSKVFRDVMAYLVLLAGMFALTTWTFLRNVPFEEPDQEIDILDYIL